MKAIVTVDGLSSNGPFIDMSREKDLRFMPVARPGDHELLFSRFEASGTGRTWERSDKAKGITHRFERDHDVPLDDANFENPDRPFRPPNTYPLKNGHALRP